MKQSLLKRIFIMTFCVCIAVTLSLTFSTARTAHAATTRASTCPYGTSVYFSLSTTWEPGDQNYAVACDGGQLRLTYQTDNNFVLYHNNHPIWATNTVDDWTTGWVANYLQFQNDGNLVMYDSNVVFGREACWASHTYGKGASTFALQSDGNLVIYRGNTPLWASHTNFY